MTNNFEGESSYSKLFIIPNDRNIHRGKGTKRYEGIESSDLNFKSIVFSLLSPKQ